jgi:hypothetical protein
MALCRCLSTHAGASDYEEYRVNQSMDLEWLPWLQGQEFVRLVHCAYSKSSERRLTKTMLLTAATALECLQLILFNQRPLFRLIDFTQHLPCRDAVWRCRTEKSWNEQRHRDILDSQTSNLEHFPSSMRMLSLYANERAILDQVQSSQRLSSLLRPELGFHLQDCDMESNKDRLLSSGASLDDITYLDQVIHDAIASKHHPHRAGEHEMHDPIVHVISILRDIPLRMIYASVGWQANVADMRRTRERLKEYLQCNRGTAKMCLWHAAQVYLSMRNYRYPAHYACLSFTIATTYILLYDQILRATDTQGDVTRLDKLKRKTDADVWARDDKGSRVHITGIGILNSTESSRRLLIDAENILRSQRPWRGISESLADCFAQMSQGRRPRAS